MKLTLINAILIDLDTSKKRPAKRTGLGNPASILIAKIGQRIIGDATGRVG
jgi:hypothetical protein